VSGQKETRHSSVSFQYCGEYKKTTGHVKETKGSRNKKSEGGAVSIRKWRRIKRKKVGPQTQRLGGHPPSDHKHASDKILMNTNAGEELGDTHLHDPKRMGEVKK